MRDLDQLRERSDETTVRRLGLFVMAGFIGAAALMALGVVSGGSSQPSSAPDPLAALGEASAASEQRGAAGEDDEVDSAAVLGRLSFPATLVGDEATIEATVEAAAAEHAALTGRAESGLGRPSSRVPRANTLPASTLATDQSARLMRSAKHDPLIAEALPERSADGTMAPHGADGPFMLQVVSYEKRDEAERFVDALRLRGHRAYMGQAEVPGRSRYYRVRIGPFASRREAVEYQRRFALSERIQTLVVDGPK